MNFRESFEIIQDKYGDIPGEHGAELRRRKYARYFLRMGRDVYIAEGCRFYHPDRIVLEDDARFNVGALIYGSGGVWIGRHARIGPRCFIHSANHEISESELAFFERGYIDAAVRVGDNVLISANVSILPGARIGDHTFIGCGAVVTKGQYPGSSRLLGVPAKQAAKESPQVPEAAPEAVIYAQTDSLCALAKHLLSCLGLPQIGIVKEGQIFPASARSVLLMGEVGWSPELPDHLKVWSMAEGTSTPNNPDFPNDRIFNYAYAGRDGAVDADGKIAQSFFWLMTRLEKSPGRLSIIELHEWIKTLSLLDIDASRHQVLLSKIVKLLAEKYPIGLRGLMRFDKAQPNLRQWAKDAEIRVLKRIRSPVWQFFTHTLVAIQFAKDVAMDVLVVRNLKLLRNLAARFKAANARVSGNTVALRLAMLEQGAKAGYIERLKNIATNPQNGQELLAATIFSYVNGLPDAIKQLDELLQSPDWALPDVAFPLAKKGGSGFCYSPLALVWLYMQARNEQSSYQMPEETGLIIERIESLAWKVFGNGKFVDKDKKLVSRSLIDAWQQLHSANCPEGAQFMLEESSYQATTRTLETAWLDVFKTIQHAADAPFIRLKPWPAGYKAAISLRYDVDRPVHPSRITELVRLHAKYANAACATWYYFNGHPDIKAQSKYMLRHWQEIGIHVELASDAYDGLGVTHHSAPTSDYWRGDRSNRDLENSGGSYCEFMASSLHTPRPAWRGSEDKPIGDIWITPLHFPMEGSTRDVNLHYFDKLLPYFRGAIDSGGYAIIGSHPDLNQNILIQLLKREKTRDIWFASVRDVVERCKCVMGYGEVYIADVGSGRALCANNDIADLAVEYWQPHEDVSKEISLQLKAGKPRQLL
jgi:acetyltransferase-like isoleucine patch superfamily enzyme